MTKHPAIPVVYRCCDCQREFPSVLILTDHDDPDAVRAQCLRDAPVVCPACWQRRMDGLSSAPRQMTLGFAA